MAVKFKNTININDQYTFPSVVGTDGQYLSITDAAAGTVDWTNLGDIDGSKSNFVYYDAKNSTGSTIPVGTAVMAVGSDGNSGHILIAPMNADGSVEPKYFIGVADDDISNGQIGKVVHFGTIDQVNTNAFSNGDVLWCDPATPGGFTTTEPQAPSPKLTAAIVLNSSTNGKLLVRVQGNEGIHELHDVKLTSITDGDTLVWDDANGYWKNEAIGKSSLITDNFTGNDSTTVFTLSSEILSENNTSVYFDGVYQSKSNYSLSGDQLTFTTAPPSGTSVEVVSIKNVLVTEPQAGDYSAFYPLISDLDAYVDGSGTANYVPKWTDGDTIGNSVIYDDGTNVGIGTSSPNNLVSISNGEIDGLLDFNNGAFITGTATNSRFDIYTNNVQRAIFYEAGDISFIDTSSNPAFYWDASTARLGLGTTSPNGRLNIQSSASGTYLLNLDYNNGTDGGGFYQAASTDLTLFLKDASSVTKVQIASTGDSYFNGGNVGIGTSSPASLLSLESTSPDILLKSTDTNTTATNDIYAQFSTSTGGLGSGGKIAFEKSGTWNSTFTSTRLTDITFHTVLNGTQAERMRIDSSGRVGIGTSSPNNPLHINSSSAVLLNAQCTGPSSFIQLTNSGGAAGVKSTSNELILWTSTSGTERMRIDSSGNVGVGTTTPDSKLDVYGDIKIGTTANSNFKNRSETHWIQYNGGNTTNDTFIRVASINAASIGRTISFHTNSAERMRIDSSGNVGIGTSSLTEKLHVEGKIKLSGRNYNYGQENHHIELTEDNGSVYIGNVNQSGYIANGSYLGAQIYHINTTQTGLASIFLSADGSIDFYSSSFTAGSTSKAASRKALLQTDGDFHVLGDVIAYSTTVSDERLKDNITTIDNALDKVCELRGVEYDWNASSRAGQHDMGVIAQEVEKVFPFIVREKEMPLVDGNTYKTVDYEKLVGVLIEAVKELKQEIESLKSK